MTKPESADPAPETEAQGAVPSATEAGAEATPPPEPMTPEKVESWNRYLDRYVAGGVLLLVLFAAIRPITNSTIWPHLKAGEQASSRGPVTTDPFSYTMQGERWVNVPWLFQVAGWQIYGAATKAFPADPARGEFAASVLLIGLNALLLTVAGAFILAIRRRGPGLWWASVCLMIALGGALLPAGGYAITPAIGGLSYGKIQVGPETWGLLLLAIELFLIHRAVNEGKTKSLYAMPVVFLIWANVDPGFLYGLLILAGWLLGAAIKPPARRTPESPAPPSVPMSLGILAASVAVCMLNPSLWRAYGVAAEPYLDMISNLTGARQKAGLPLTGDLLSFFGKESQAYFDSAQRGSSRAMVGFYLVVVFSGLVSFAINWRRFALGRFLAFAIAALLWGGLIRLAPQFALVFAAVLTLNGQEWYQSAYGTRGRLGLGWKLWSDGGRAATILVVFAFLFTAITGYFGTGAELPFGFGFDKSQFAFNSANYLRSSGVEGRVLNLSLSHGDALIWADPLHKTFIDNRQGLFPDRLRKTLQDLRAALARNEPDAYGAILKEYGASVVMLSPDDDRKVYTALRANPDFVPIYDGGNSVLFGWLKAEGPDVERFRKERLDASSLVYQRTSEIPVPERPPASTGTIDRVLRHRALQSTEPEVSAAFRWLGGSWSGPSQQGLEPADCYMAIREARAALARNPDDALAFRALAMAYGALQDSELALLYRGPRAGGIGGENASDGAIRLRSPQSLERLNALAPLTNMEVPDAFQLLQQQFLSEILAEAQAASLDTPRSVSFEAYRFRQLVTALSYAIQTYPPPRTAEGRQELANLNAQLADLYQQNQALDLARDRLRDARDLVGPANFPEEYQQLLDQLTEQIEAFRAQLDEQSLASPEQFGPIQRAIFAQQNGFPGLAIEELRQAEGAGVSLATVRPILVDLYCRIGQPDQAFDLLESTQAADPSLATGPGTAAYRQGLVYLLLGFYPNTAVYWQNYAIPDVRRTQVMQALSAGRTLLTGEPVTSVRTALEVTGTPESTGLVETQATWEAELGFALLESGMPQDVTNERGEVIREGAASHFKKALELNPETAVRPLLVYYLEKLGVEVPATPTADEPPAEDATDATSTPEPTAENGEATPTEGPKPEPPAEEPKAEPTPDPPANPATEEPKAESPAEEPKAEETPSR